MFAPSAKTLTVRGGLSENAGYSFRILVANTVGIVSTSDRRFSKSLGLRFSSIVLTFSHAETTDVQAVTATFIDSSNMSTILCEFVSGSNAIGCMVVLTSGGQEATYNLSKSETVTNCSILTVTLEFPQSHIDQVEAFDIEANGSVSSLAIPGLLSNILPTSCTPIDTSTCKLQCNTSCINATCIISSYYSKTSIINESTMGIHYISYWNCHDSIGVICT